MDGHCSEDTRGRRLAVTALVAAALVLVTADPARAQSTPLANDARIVAAIDAPGDLDTYTFEAQAGDLVHARVGETDDVETQLVRIDLLDPSGAPVPDGVWGGPTVAAIAPAALADSGTYTLTVQEGTLGQTNVFPYDLYFFRARGAGEAGPLAMNSVVAGRIDLADLDSFTFAGAAGQEVEITVTETSAGPRQPAVFLYHPDGTLIDAAGDSGSAATVRATLPVEGVYVILVTDGSNGESDVFDYELEILGSAAPSVPALGPPAVWILGILLSGLGWRSQSRDS